MAELPKSRIGRALTRRQLAAVAAGSAAVSLAALKGVAQSPASATGETQDWDKAARDSRREDSEALAQFEIPMSLEPAFRFTP
jgi:hypothetical protein